jgi:hypothetical protein
MHDPWVEIFGTIWVGLIGLAAMARLAILIRSFMRSPPHPVEEASAQVATDSDDAADPELTIVAASDAE